MFLSLSFLVVNGHCQVVFRVVFLMLYPSIYHLASSFHVVVCADSSFFPTMLEVSCRNSTSTSRVLARKYEFAYTPPCRLLAAALRLRSCMRPDARTSLGRLSRVLEEPSKQRRAKPTVRPKGSQNPRIESGGVLFALPS